MRESYYVHTSDRVTIVSADVVNNISEYLIAKVGTEEELGELVMAKINEQEARTEAFKMAYRDVPIPSGSISLEVRRELQAKRNELAEKYYQEIIKKS